MGDKPWFIEFFAPWCPHCQHLAPVWDSLHLKVRDEVNIARVDCTSAKSRPLCVHFDVHGYPTLIYFPLDSTQKLRYEGKRTIEGFESWLQEQLHGTSKFDDYDIVHVKKEVQ